MEMKRDPNCPATFNDLLKLSLRLTDQESKDWKSDAQPMDEERRKWLSEAMDHFSQNDDIVRLKECVRSLQQVPIAEIVGKEMVKEKEDALEEIQFLVERLDNAKDLHLLGGLQTVIQYLCSEHSILRWKAAEVIAGAVQNNPFCQTACTQFGTIPILLLLITSDEVEMVRIKAVYALSGLIQNCQVSSDMFLRNRGYEALHVAMKSESIKLRIKAAFLIRRLVNQDDTTQGNRIMELFINDGLAPTLIHRLKGPHDESHEHIVGVLSDLIESCDASTFAVLSLDKSFLKTLENRKKELTAIDPERFEEETSSIDTVIEKMSKCQAK